MNPTIGSASDTNELSHTDMTNRNTPCRTSKYLRGIITGVNKMLVNVAAIQLLIQRDQVAPVFEVR